MRRPGFDAVLSRVQNRAAGGVIVARLDRFARTVLGALEALREIDAAGGELVVVDEALDTSTPTGKFAHTMMLALGELQLDQIRDSWADAQAHAVKRGVHIASKPPTGYTRGADGRLVVTPTAAPVIADAFRRRAGGASYSEIAALLTRHGVAGPYGSTAWTTGAVRGVLQNPVYTGQARGGNHTHESAHPAIVTPAEFRAVQNMRRTPPAPLRSPDGALLAGILRCAGCRYVMKPDTQMSRGEKLRLYRCRGEHAAGRCRAPASVLGRVIEPYVSGRFFEALGPDGILAQPAAIMHETDELQRALDVAQAELVEWVEAVSISSIGSQLYGVGLDARQHAVGAAQSALDAASAQTGVLPPIADLYSLWPNLRTEEKRRLLAAGIDAVMLRRGRDLESRTRILFAGQAPSDLPRRGHRVPLSSFAFPDDLPPDIGATVA